MFSEKRFNSLVLLLCLCFADFSFAAVRHRYTRNDLSILNPSGATTFSKRVAVRGLGGVSLQAKLKFYDSAGKPIDANEVTILRYDAEDAKLILNYKTSEFEYEIAEDDFDRIFSWVENKGTGFFSAHDLTSKQLRDGGFSEKNGGYVAIEFADSATLCLVAEYLDFFNDDLVTKPANRQELMANHNRGLKSDKDDLDFDWITSDLDSAFRATLSGKKIEISGTLYAYYRRDSDDPERIFVHDIEVFRSGDLPQLSKFTTDAMSLTLHVNALKFARSVALLRTLHHADPLAWERFAESYFTDEIEYAQK